MSTHLPLPFHKNGANCERARLQGCKCHCGAAGHQHDLIVRAVTCHPKSTNGPSQLLSDLEDVYGGFHTTSRDAVTKSRRTPPDSLATISLSKGRGASWEEGLILDELMHAAFVSVMRSSQTLTEAERASRQALVMALATGAAPIVQLKSGAMNIRDGHVWCSIMAEANDPAPNTALTAHAQYGKICYPRSPRASQPASLVGVRALGVAHVQTTRRNHAQTPGVNEILHLIGSATCPDLWHHPAAVKYSLQPFLTSTGHAPSGTTTIATAAKLSQITQRWNSRGNW